MEKSDINTTSTFCMEIIAWDSSMTILISKFDEIVEKLLKSNPLIEDLEEYNKN